MFQLENQFSTSYPLAFVGVFIYFVVIPKSASMVRQNLYRMSGWLTCKFVHTVNDIHFFLLLATCIILKILSFIQSVWNFSGSFAKRLAQEFPLWQVLLKLYSLIYLLSFNFSSPKSMYWSIAVSFSWFALSWWFNINYKAWTTYCCFSCTWCPKACMCFVIVTFLLVIFTALVYLFFLYLKRAWDILFWLPILGIPANMSLAHAFMKSC